MWDAESYINAIESYGAPDLKEFADKYYTGKNLVVVVAGGHVGKDEVKTLAEKYFGTFRPANASACRSRSIPAVTILIPSDGSYRQILLGWDVTEIKGSSSANVMMSMLSKRLERSFNEVYDPVRNVKNSSADGCAD